MYPHTPFVLFLDDCLHQTVALSGIVMTKSSMHRLQYFLIYITPIRIRTSGSLRGSSLDHVQPTENWRTKRYCLKRSPCKRKEKYFEFHVIPRFADFGAVIAARFTNERQITVGEIRFSIEYSAFRVLTLGIVPHVGIFFFTLLLISYAYPPLYPVSFANQKKICFSAHQRYCFKVIYSIASCFRKQTF